MGGGVSTTVGRRYSTAVRRIVVPQESSIVEEYESKLVDWPTVEKTAKFINSYGNYNSWDYDIWLLKAEDLPMLCSLIITQHALPTKFDINFGKWCGLCKQVKLNMSTPLNPYHNLVHLMDVMQTCAVFLGEMGAASIVNDTDILALFLAAFVHDIGHPGLNNAYQVHAETPLALRYNDISVLEHHHCALAFEVFKDPKSNIFLDIQPALRKAVRKSIINLVLSTDMMTHFTLLEELKGCITHNFTSLATVTEMESVILSEKDRMIILRSILHAADISNPAKAWSTSKKWSDLVVQEFFAQGDVEKAEQLPVSMNMDRSRSFQDEISLNFNDFMVAPFFFTMLNALPKLEKAVRHLESNRRQWNSIMRLRVSKIVMLKDYEKEEELAKWTAKESDFTTKVKSALDFADKKLRRELIVTECE